MAKKPDQNLFQKLTKLFRSGPVVRRKIRNLDTAVAVADKTKSSGALLFQKSMAPTYATITANAYNLSERLMRYQDFCLTGDTLVATPTEEGCMRIDEICRLWSEGQRDHYVFSYDVEKNLVVSAKVTCAKQTGVYETVNVLLDDGSTIRCTSNHRFMLRDGSYVEAGSLKSGTALMPFNRQSFSTPYRYVQTHARGWKPEHTLVAESAAGQIIREGEHVHHKNFRHRDNRHDNLEIMTEHDHMSLHAKINNMRFSDPVQREHMSDVMKVRWEPGGDLRENVSSNVEKAREGNRSRRVLFNKTYKPGRFNVGRQDQGRLDNGNADRFFKFQDICNAYRPGMTVKELSTSLGQSEYKIRKRICWSGFSSFQDFEANYSNHKVVSVTPGSVEPVYDIEVGDLHNFALAKRDELLGAQGIVFVHNSEMEYTPELAAALDIYADETCAQDEKGRVLHIYSDNEKIREILEDLFYNTLNVEFNLRAWTRNLPVHKDTVIPLLDGTEMTIENLAKKMKENPNWIPWVYSVQDRTLRMVPGKVTWCDLTRKDSELVRVWLDDGSYVDCTPDHEWVLRDGKRKAAKDLSSGDAMMPLYRDVSSKESGHRLEGYERTYDPSSEKYEYTHRLVAESSAVESPKKWHVVHHKDFNKLNNSPDNLLKMTWRNHAMLHLKTSGTLMRPAVVAKRMSGIDKWLRSDAHREIAKVQLKKLQDSGLMRKSWDEYNASEKHTTDNATRSVASKRLWIARREEMRNKLTIKFDDRCVDMVVATLRDQGKYLSPVKLGSILTNDVDFMSHFSSINEGTGRDLTKSLKSHTGFESLLIKAGFSSYLSLVSECLPEIAETPWFKRAEKKSATMRGIVPSMREHRRHVVSPTYMNHKVDRVEWLTHTADVYCMEVMGPDGEHDRHNFAVMTFNADGTKSKSSIISNNCKYGDMFLYNDVSPEHGVINAFPIPVNEIEREENYDPNDPMAVRYRWVTLGNRTLENWEVTHFRLLGNDMFLPYGSSVIEPARRIWRQLILIEDAMLVYRVVRAPERRVFYIDVANIPPENVPMYVEEQRKNLRSSQVIDRTTGRVDLRYNPLCNSLKTLIKLQDGRTIPLSKVIEEWESGNRDMWAYSVDINNSRLAPGKIVWAGVTRKDAELVRVHLDDGTWYDCTPDHRWMLRNGEYVEASSLKEGDSLMALYTKKTSTDEGHKIAGYEKIYDPFSKQYVLTHRNNVLVEHGMGLIKGKVIHHVDFDKKNNNPSNLRPMSWGEHQVLHGSLAAERNRSPSGRETSRLRMIKTWEEKKINRDIFINMWKDASIRDKRVKKLTLRYDEEFISHCLRVFVSIGKNLSTKESEFLDALNADNQFSHYIASRNQGFKNGYLKMTRSGLQTRLKSLGCTKGFESFKRLHLMTSFKLDEIKSFCKSVPGCTRKNVLDRFMMSRNDLVEFVRLSGESYEEFSDQYLPGAARYKNHKVVRVERLEHREDTGCITVEKYHNFAAGPSADCFTDQDFNKVNSYVYLHNSVDEDYFIPVRGGESGTKIDTLAGGQNAAAVEDVAYIQKKLFAALKIPRAYLGYDEALSCVVPETPVDLLDGRTLSIEQIKGELDAGKDVWVYSVDRETLEMKPGRVVWAGPTRKGAELVRITLDNGASFTCTPDHKWMLRDGEWCQAQDLTAGTSLMPLHKRKSSLHGGSDYEQVFDPASGKWKWTHQLVADRCEVETHESALIEQRRVVHHRDVNRFNNSPTNLVRMGFEAHRKLHAVSLAETRKKALSEGKYSGLNNGWAKKCRDEVSHLWSTQRLISWCIDHRPTSKRQIVGGYGLSETQLDRLVAENGMSYRQFADSYVSGGYKLARRGTGGHENPNYEREKRGPGFLGAKFEVVECGVCHTLFQRNVKTKKKFCSQTCRLSFGNGRKAPDPIYVRDGLLNHTVVSVEFLAERRDTWCIEVAGTHTFGLSNGSIISNSKATLAQEDIRFSRTINVIQKTLVSELNKLAIIHLYTNGFDSEDLQNFTLRLSNPSTVAQQQKLELWRAKFEIGGSAPEGHMSKEFIRKEIWGLNDEQCEEIDEQRLKEKMIDQAIDAAEPEEEGGEEVGGGEEIEVGDEEAGEEIAGPGEESGGEDLFAGDNVFDKEPGLSLITAGDDPSDDEDFPAKVSLKDLEVPVKAQRQLDKALYNRSRIRHHGASKIHMPDFHEMTKADSKSMTDPYDKDFMNSYIRNPFGESASRPTYKTPLNNDILTALKKMSESPKFSTANSQPAGSPQVLSENLGEIDQADSNEFREVYIIDEDPGSDQ